MTLDELIVWLIIPTGGTVFAIAAFFYVNHHDLN